MFKIKICGIKDVATAASCVRAGASAVGLNFYEKSKRCVSVETASHIAAALKGDIAVVGLFVNHTLDRVCEIAKFVGLDYLQFHGDESASILQGLDAHPDLEHVRVIRAIRLAQENHVQSLAEMDVWLTAGGSGRLAGFIVDTFQPGQFGGTGLSMDWEWLSKIKLPTSVPIILAGGLEPQNVAEAIATVRPFGVDVAGGVENIKHQKDPALIKAFVQNANSAFDQ